MRGPSDRVIAPDRDPHDAEPTQAARCPRCGSDLDLHQPDPALTDRLLATCKVCKAWFLAIGDRRRLVRLVVGPSRRWRKVPGKRPRRRRPAIAARPRAAIMGAPSSDKLEGGPSGVDLSGGSSLRGPGPDRDGSQRVEKIEIACTISETVRRAAIAQNVQVIDVRRWACFLLAMVATTTIWRP